MSIWTRLSKGCVVLHTCDPLCAVCTLSAEHLLLLLEEEVCLVRGQAAEVSPRRKGEPQLPGRAQTRLSDGEQLTVGATLAVCEGGKAPTLKV